MRVKDILNKIEEERINTMVRINTRTEDYWRYNTDNRVGIQLLSQIISMQSTEK